MVKEKTNVYLLSIVGIVAVVGIVVLLLNTGQLSTQISDGDLAGETIVATCTDTDGGLHTTEKGTISGGLWKTTGKMYTPKTDSCKDSTYIYEYYCSSPTTAFYTTQSCVKKWGPSASCDDGECVFEKIPL